MDDEPPDCPQCGIALLVDAPLNLIMRWPELIERYGSIALEGGWERLPLEGSVPADSAAAASCRAAFVGDLITSEIVCPRCRAAIYEVLRF